MKTPIMVNKKKPNFISKSRSYISIYVYIIVFLKGVVLKFKKIWELSILCLPNLI